MSIIGNLGHKSMSYLPFAFYLDEMLEGDFLVLPAELPKEKSLLTLQLSKQSNVFALEMLPLSKNFCCPKI